MGNRADGRVLVGEVDLLVLATIGTRQLVVADNDLKSVLCRSDPCHYPSVESRGKLVVI